MTWSIRRNDRSFNRCTNTGEISVYIQIRKTQYAHILSLQIKIPLPVIFILRPLIMPTPVQFDHKAGRWTKKVHNIWANGLLPPKTCRMFG